MRVGCKGISAIHRRTGNSFTACRQKRCNFKNLSPFGWKHWTAKNYTECNSPKQNEKHWQRHERKNREPLLHCAVYIELKAKSMDALKELQSDISMELTRSKISVDRLTLRQKEGFLSVLPIGSNQFGAQYERVLPASSVANLYPFNFSGKTDPQGLYIGRDKFGSATRS